MARIMKVVMSPRTRLLVFTMLVGIIVVLVLGFAGINLPYSSKYLIFVVAIVLYFVIATTLERYSRRKRGLRLINHKPANTYLFGDAILPLGDDDAVPV